jgi:hypothetical protein
MKDSHRGKIDDEDNRRVQMRYSQSFSGQNNTYNYQETPPVEDRYREKPLLEDSTLFKYSKFDRSNRSNESKFNANRSRSRRRRHVLKNRNVSPGKESPRFSLTV